MKKIHKIPVFKMPPNQQDQSTTLIVA